MARQHGGLIRPRDPVAVIGYGSQGAAQAVLLRLAELQVRVGLPAGSRSRRRARADGFPVMVPRRAVAGARTIAVLGPDQLNARIAAALSPVLESGALVVFAHGFAIHFGGWKPPAGVDVAVVAPNAPGPALVSAHEGGPKVSSFIAVYSDSTGTALARAKGWARATCADGDGVVETTVERETVGDLFGEQAVLCGGLWSLVRSGYDTLVSHGFPPQHAEIEVLGQLHLLVGLLQHEGASGFLRTISAAASLGAVETAARFDAHNVRVCRRVYDEIASGRFAERFLLAADDRDQKWRVAWDGHRLSRRAR